MAENPLEGILGDEEEKEETTSQGREAQTDAFAAILASNLPLIDPEVARRTREYLDKQSRLLELQAHQLHDTHALHLRELRGRVSEGPLRRAGGLCALARGRARLGASRRQRRPHGPPRPVPLPPASR